MIEILLNAAKVFVSKDARETAAGLKNLFENSPDWREDICTIEARISKDEQERAFLLQDVIASKLKTLGYTRSAVSDYNITFSELVHNAFEHGTKKVRKKIVRIVADVSPTYIAITVYNPRRSDVDLESWFSSGAEQLRATSLHGGGRGLITVSRRSDTVEQVGKKGVKATIYRERVRFEKYALGDTVLVIALNGHSNPSFGRRLVKFVENIDTPNLVVCLQHIDPDEFTTDEMREFGDFLRQCESSHESNRKWRDAEDDLATWMMQEILSFASQQGELTERDIRIVCGDEDLIDLLPSDLVTRSVTEALNSLTTT